MSYRFSGSGRCANNVFGTNPDCTKFFDAKPSSEQICCSRRCSIEYQARARKRAQWIEKSPSTARTNEPLHSDTYLKGLL